jgi:hypothetical protein
MQRKREEKRDVSRDKGDKLEPRMAQGCAHKKEQEQKWGQALIS